MNDPVDSRFRQPGYDPIGQRRKGIPTAWPLDIGDDDAGGAAGADRVRSADRHDVGARLVVGMGGLLGAAGGHQGGAVAVAEVDGDGGHGCGRVSGDC